VVDKVGKGGLVVFLFVDESLKVDEDLRSPILQHTYTLSLQALRHISSRAATKGPLLPLAHPFIEWNHPSSWLLMSRHCLVESFVNGLTGVLTIPRSRQW